MKLNSTHLTRRLLCLVAVLAFASAKTSLADGNGYQLPPQEVVDIIDASPPPSVSLSPDGQWMMLIQRDAMPAIEDVSRRMLRLGGIRIDPAADGRFQTSYSKALVLRPRDADPNDDGKSMRIPLPDDPKISSVSWSHNSVNFAFSLVTETGQQLWLGSVDSPKRPRLLTDRLSTVMGGFTWMPDGQSILCKLVPENRGAEPADSGPPVGPNIQESDGNRSPTRTYQDLLTNFYDEQLFAHYATTQLAILKADGSVNKLGDPQIFSSVRPSPSGQYALVTTIEKPFSYLMTYRSFPRNVSVWKLSANADGDSIKVLAKIPMDENIPIEGVPMGPRSFQWKTSEPATLLWTEALDGGDPNQSADHRDKYMTLSAPFEGPGKELLRVQHRAAGISFFENPSQILVSDYDRDRRWIRSQLYDLDSPSAEPKTLADRSIRDRYGDPGRVMTKVDQSGRSIARQDGPWIYRSGSGASPKGSLPFLDRQNTETLETERLWRCEEGQYESVVAILSSGTDALPTIITNRQAPTMPPNYFLRDLENNSVAALTDFKDPTPQIRGIKKQLVKYERSDGVPLSATLYLPADYQAGTRLPLLVWAYPREFNDAKTAGQISGTPSRFTRMSSISHLTLLTQGYAIMDSATMPVIGDPETMNDTFIEQIVDAAQAAIDKAVDMGVADRNRVAVGGHSYGAFMTANLLAHCDLFKAGVARSGAYNRTLTPFGFQSERRPYWQAKTIYHSISPFMHADKINEPLLLIHGEKDNNSGTFPIQSKRMYQAIKGNGGTVRLCMLPFESHGYRARESVLHTQAEMIAWLNRHVKNLSTEPIAKR
ncbi:MAG: prolyl oligopeptidase family serine peptidase [Planctomycetota bacterium]